MSDGLFDAINQLSLLPRRNGFVFIVVFCDSLRCGRYEKVEHVFVKKTETLGIDETVPYLYVVRMSVKVDEAYLVTMTEMLHMDDDKCNSTNEK